MLAETLQPVLPPRRHRWWLWGLVLVVVLAVAGVAIAGLVYAHSYSPLADYGGVSGTLTPKTLKIEAAANQNLQYVLVGPAGTVGTSYFTLSNYGHHRVTVLGSTAGDPYTKLTVRWAPLDPRSGSPDGAARPFPASIDAGQAITIETTETQPRCGAGGQDGRTTSGTSLRWSAFGAHHVFYDSGALGSSDMPIMTCAPANVLPFLSPK